ncbi:hypothetical protein HGG70_05180 [Rhodobacteraceae bacterium R_SAG4]|nr:hypothetical protein [Rhodobacteraceae bacterium R_SAG4]
MDLVMDSPLALKRATFAPTHHFTPDKHLLFLKGVKRASETGVQFIYSDLRDLTRAYVFSPSTGAISVPNETLTPIITEEPMTIQPRPNKQSRDRIQFVLKSNHLARKAYKALLEECFGIAPGSFDPQKELVIVCRPSQFARFVVLRHSKYSEANDMSGLDMKLLSPNAPSNMIDCSENPNTAIGEPMVA